MTRTHHRSVFLLAAIALLMASPLAGAADMYAVDHAHSLTTDDAKESYQSDGVASGDVYGLDMSMTVADKAEDVGLSEWKHSSAGAAYFRIQYDEGIKREVRLYIPSSYWTPRLKQDLEAVNSDVTADFEPGQGNYTVVTMTLSEPTTAVFRVPWHRGAIADSRRELADFVNDSTGFSLPSFAGGGDEWQYIEQGVLSTNTTYMLQTNESKYTIQYDADASQATTQWITVRSCESSTDAPVCTFKKTGQPNQTYLLSKASTPPQVRYKTGSSSVSSLQSSINDLEQAVDSLLDDVSGWLPTSNSSSTSGGDE